MFKYEVHVIPFTNREVKGNIKVFGWNGSLMDGLTHGQVKKLYALLRDINTYTCTRQKNVKSALDHIPYPKTHLLPL